MVTTASPYGVGEAVLEAGRAEEVDTVQGSPRNLGLAVAQLVKSAVNLYWLQSRKGNATVTSGDIAWLPVAVSVLPLTSFPGNPADKNNINAYRLIMRGGFC